MISAIILAAAIGQTVGVRQEAPKATLTAGQRTSLGNHISARWPVSLANVVSFDCSRETLSATTGQGDQQVTTYRTVIQCAPTVSEAPGAAGLFSLLRSGQTLVPGLSAGAQQRTLWPREYTGSELTALGTLTSSLWPAVSGTYMTLRLARQGATDVVATASYCQQMTQAEAYTAFQAGQTLAPCN